MTILPLTQVKASLNEIVEGAVNTHDRVTITRRGVPAAVLISVDDLEVLEESLYWLSQPGIRDDIAQSHAEEAAGELWDEASVRGRYGSASA